ncbi:lipid II flippase MurJ [Pseudorhodoferax aquiterrae]|nr:lipid II flippase MurJ [Pseudorhodoferax aquiterrae]
MSMRTRMAQHRADASSYHRRIVAAFLAVSGFVAIAKLVGAFKEMVLAWRYGTSAWVDAYVFLFNVVTWPMAVWFSVLMAVVVPLVARLRSVSEDQSRVFIQELNGLNWVLSGVAAVGVAAGLPHALRHWSGLHGEALELALAWAGPFALLCGLGMATTLQSVLILASERHDNTLLEAVPSLVLLVVLWLPAHWIGQPLVWGSLAGFAAHLLCTVAVLQLRGQAVWPRLGFRSPGWRTFRAGMGTMLLAQMLASGTVLIDQWLAAPIGEGAVSTLSYAGRVLALLLGLGAMALGRATLPVLADAQSVSGARARAVAIQWVKWSLLAGAAAALVAVPLVGPGVRLLFERGAFAAEDTAAVAGALQFGLWQVPAYFGSLVLISLFSAQGRYRPLLLAGLLGMAAKLVTAWWLLPSMGLQGVMLSSAAFYTAGLVLLMQLQRPATQS